MKAACFSDMSPPTYQDCTVPNLRTAQPELSPPRKSESFLIDNELFQPLLCRNREKGYIISDCLTSCFILPSVYSFHFWIAKKYWRIYYSARLNFPRDCKIMFRGWSYGRTNTPIKSLKSINFLQSLGTDASCRSS